MNDTDWELISLIEAGQTIYEESVWWNISVERPFRFGYYGYLPPIACTQRPCRQGIRGYVNEKTFT